MKLDYKVTWKKLKDIFKMAGNVIRAEIKQDKEGKSRGMGVVTFEFPLEAVQAICILSHIMTNQIWQDVSGDLFDQWCPLVMPRS